MNKVKTIAFISQADPFTDRRAWSGTVFKLREGIENAGYKVKWVPYKINKYKLLFLKILIKLIYGKQALVDHNRYYFKMCANSIDVNKLADCDYLFFPVEGQIGAYVKSDKPAIYYSDSTFKLMVDYYWKNQPKSIIKEGLANDLKAVKHSFINFRSSQWAADSVVNDYGFTKDRTFVLEFGANLDNNDIIPSSPYKKGEVLKVFFSGVDWERKGGDIAVETVYLLNDAGIRSTLTIAGIKELPLKYKGLPYVNNLGFLNKNIPDQYRQYINAMSNSHIFLLPTKAECAGIVFCEASAFGLPIFTYNTGGICSYVRNGENGYTLPLSSLAKEFAAVIISCLNNDELTQLHQGGLNLYKNIFNWNSWGKRFRGYIEKVEKENERTIS